MNGVFVQDFLFQWLPTIITLSIWVIIFCGLHWLKEKVVGGVQHDFNQKLEELRSQIRSRETEISSLRDTVLSNRNQRQILVEKRKIEAVENIWKSVDQLQRYKFL
jgi:hypothetical protein